MPEIRMLDRETINQIAAGEVVERPSSIVKELVENAIDASASAVTVEIRGGGIDYLRVTDNGCGIPADEVRSAFLAHATSKIRDARDLMTVQSLGFRGEALSSISAVSKVETVTKTDGSLSGVRLVLEGGEEVSFEEIGCPEGTTLIVRKLFYNTPARRKFLKTAVTEAGYVEAFMQRLALSRPEIAFRLISENKTRLSTSGNGRQQDAVYQIFGREVAKNLLEVGLYDRGIRVEGFIGKPVISRGNRNYENYYVNGRYLRDPLISRAIEEGYRGHAMVHKFPFSLLMIRMDPRMVDVNVHPSKMEMHFSNREDLYEVLVRAVKDAFRDRELIPKVTVGREEKDRVIPPPAPEPFEVKRREKSGNQNFVKQDVKQGLKPDQGFSYDKIFRTGDSQVLSVREKDSDGADSLKEADRSRAADSLRDADRSRAADSLKEADRSRTADSLKEADRLQAAEGQLTFADETVLSEIARDRRRIIGQVFGTFWLFEYEGRLYFVDQHAAHEKVMYERLMREIRDNKAASQILAPPIVLSLSLRDRDRLKTWREAFEKLGFVLEEFGGNEFCIRAVPTVLLGLDERTFFLELLDQTPEDAGRLSTDLITSRVASMACKAAVKGNTRMSVREMEALLDDLMKLDNPYQCPHGRPTMISMSRYELEKKFKRIQD